MTGVQTQPSGAVLTINSSNDIERWRFVCPNGHTQWEPTNNHWWCRECANSHDPDATPEFYELLDRKTGETFERDEVRIEGYRAKSQ